MIDHDTLLEIQAIGDQRRAERRRFIKMASAGIAATGGLAALSACGTDNASLPPQIASPTPSPTATTAAVDVAVLNFALNLEYLEANYYNLAAQGAGVSAQLQTGVGTQGAVVGGRQVAFSDPSVAAYAREIAADELAHVLFLRSQLGSAAVAQPAINIDGTATTGAFAQAARAAGVATPAGTFDPYMNDDTFLLGAALLTDVGVTAYKGSATLISSKVILEAAAGILAVEAYHSGLIRTLLYRRSVQVPAPTATAPNDRSIIASISAARDAIDGTTASAPGTAPALYANDDQSVGPVTFAPPTPVNGTTRSNIVPSDANAIVFGRRAANVLNIAYLNKAAVTSGGFFPAGVNGSINASAAN